MLVMDAAQEAAERVLRADWDGTFPVDPIAIARRFGIEVKKARFRDPDTSGAIIANGKDDVTIFFAEDDSYPRQTFTVAHELGHYFERRGADDDAYSFVEKRHSSNYDLHEFFADEFAGNLLMPTGLMCQLWAEGRTVGQLADLFSVSTAAVRKRIDRLRKTGKIA